MAKDNFELVKAAEEFLASAKAFDGNPIARMGLAKQADNLRYHAEDGLGTMLRQWDQLHLTASLSILTSQGILQRIPEEGTTTAKELSDAVQLDESAIRTYSYILLGRYVY